MALIDFKCKDCKEEFFEIVRSSEETVVCPKCKSEKLERIYKGKSHGKAACTGSCSCCSGCH